MAKGGLTKGKSHKEGGIPMKVKDTGQNIEVEGGEIIINKKSVSDTKKHSFDGQQLTKCEIASKINEADGNGVKIDCDSVEGKKYKFLKGGKVFSKGGIVIPFENIVHIKRPRRNRKISGDLESGKKLPKIVYYLKGKTKYDDFDNDEIYSAEYVEEIKDKGVRVMRDQDFQKGGGVKEIYKYKFKKGDSFDTGVSFMIGGENDKVTIVKLEQDPAMLPSYYIGRYKQKRSSKFDGNLSKEELENLVESGKWKKISFEKGGKTESTNEELAKVKLLFKRLQALAILQESGLDKKDLQNNIDAIQKLIELKTGVIIDDIGELNLLKSKNDKDLGLLIEANQDFQKSLRNKMKSFDKKESVPKKETKPKNIMDSYEILSKWANDITDTYINKSFGYKDTMSWYVPRPNKEATELKVVVNIDSKKGRPIDADKTLLRNKPFTKQNLPKGFKYKDGILYFQDNKPMSVEVINDYAENTYDDYTSYQDYEYSGDGGFYIIEIE